MKKRRRLSNRELVGMLKEVEAAMEIKGVNRFRIRAYQNAIAVIDNLTTSVYDFWENKRLDEIEGVGHGLSDHLNELFTTGKVREWGELLRDLPQGMFSLLVLRGVGPKTAYKLASRFELNDREKALKVVKKAAMNGKIREIEGFGEKSEQEILNGIEELKKHKREKERMLLIKAEEVANRVIGYLNELDCIDMIEPLGSLRRRSATVGDVDIAVATNSPEQVIDHFVKFPEVREVLSKGDTMSEVLLANKIQVDLLIVPPESAGSLLQHFTGSKQHNILLRTYALGKGFSLSQYGIKKKSEIKTFSNEKSFYSYIGLEWIPPEIRSGKGEIDSAADGKLPKLIDLKDIKGDIHVHTTDSSDGISTIEEVVDKAKDLGYEYIGISDHSPSVQSRGRYDVLGIVDNKRRIIEQINDSEDMIRVLFGYEINILADASLSLPDDILQKLDYSLAGIHTSFNQDRETMTKRLISAIRNPYVNVIAHPTGRLINEREAYEVDWESIFKEVLKHGKFLEINSQPNRLDLPDHLVKDVVEKGIRLVIVTDAHSTDEMNLMKYGVDVARRGWCEKSNVLNTLNLEKLKKVFLNNI